MKTIKAIEILELNVNEGHQHMPPDVRDALKEGILALKERQEREQK